MGCVVKFITFQSSLFSSQLQGNEDKAPHDRLFWIPSLVVTRLSINNIINKEI